MVHPVGWGYMELTRTKAQGSRNFKIVDDTRWATGCNIIAEDGGQIGVRISVMVGPNGEESLHYFTGDDGRSFQRLRFPGDTALLLPDEPAETDAEVIALLRNALGTFSE